MHIFLFLPQGWNFQINQNQMARRLLGIWCMLGDKLQIYPPFSFQPKGYRVFLFTDWFLQNRLGVYDWVDLNVFFSRLKRIWKHGWNLVKCYNVLSWNALKNTLCFVAMFSYSWWFLSGVFLQVSLILGTILANRSSLPGLAKLLEIFQLTLGVQVSWCTPFSFGMAAYPRNWCFYYGDWLFFFIHFSSGWAGKSTYKNWKPDIRQGTFWGRIF